MPKLWQKVFVDLYIDHQPRRYEQDTRPLGRFIRFGMTARQLSSGTGNIYNLICRVASHYIHGGDNTGLLWKLEGRENGHETASTAFGRASG